MAPCPCTGPFAAENYFIIRSPALQAFFVKKLENFSASLCRKQNRRFAADPGFRKCPPMLRSQTVKPPGEADGLALPRKSFIPARLAKDTEPSSPLPLLHGSRFSQPFRRRFFFARPDVSGEFFTPPAKRDALPSPHPAKRRRRNPPPRRYRSLRRSSSAASGTTYAVS